MRESEKPLKKSNHWRWIRPPNAAGESERAGLEAQAKKASIESLRVAYEIARGMGQMEAAEKFGGPVSHNIARSAIEDGAS